MTIQVQFVIEILGRPPEHIEEALKTVALKIDAEPGVNVLEKAFNEPKLVEGSNDMYTAFAEVVLEVDKMGTLFHLLFTYMPAHVEVITPERSEMSNAEINDLANRIMQRLHDYDALAKKFMNDRQILLKQLYEHAPQLFTKEQSTAMKENLKEESSSSKRGASQRKSKSEKASKHESVGGSEDKKSSRAHSKNESGSDKKSKVKKPKAKPKKTTKKKK